MLQCELTENSRSFAQPRSLVGGATRSWMFCAACLLGDMGSKCEWRCCHPLSWWALLADMAMLDATAVLAVQAVPTSEAVDGEELVIPGSL